MTSCGGAFCGARWLILPLIAAVMSTLSACTGLQDTAEDASMFWERLFNHGETADSTQHAEKIYLSALALRDRGEPEKAMDRFKKAAQFGHPGALYEVGAKLYTLDRGVRDDTEAVNYLAESAVRGYAPAQYLLGIAFSNGRGVRQDHAWAARWYGKAARQGHDGAQYAYGVAYAAGLGLPMNDLAAYHWLLIAAAQGHPKASALSESVGDGLAGDARAQAQHRADAFQPQLEAAFADTPTVQYVQFQLRALGFNPGPVDGLLGPNTRGAISAFQRIHGPEGEPEVSPELVQTVLNVAARAG